MVAPESIIEFACSRWDITPIERIHRASGALTWLAVATNGTPVVIQCPDATTERAAGVVDLLDTLYPANHTPAVLDWSTFDDTPVILYRASTDLPTPLHYRRLAGRALGAIHAVGLTPDQASPQPANVNVPDSWIERFSPVTLPHDTVTHNDLHFGNILFSTTSAMIIDWWDASSGSAAADLAALAYEADPDAPQGSDEVVAGYQEAASTLPAGFVDNRAELIVDWLARRLWWTCHPAYRSQSSQIRPALASAYIDHATALDHPDLAADILAATAAALADDQ